MQKPTKEYLQELFNYIDGNLHHKKRRPGVQVGTRAGTFDKDGYLVIHLNKKKIQSSSFGVGLSLRYISKND